MARQLKDSLHFRGFLESDSAAAGGYSLQDSITASRQ